MKGKPVGSKSKKVCTNERVMVGGVDVSDHVTAIHTHHKVGDLITAEVEFQGVRIEEEAVDVTPGSLHNGLRQVFHLVERDAKKDEARTTRHLFQFGDKVTTRSGRRGIVVGRRSYELGPVCTRVWWEGEGDPTSRSGVDDEWPDTSDLKLGW